MVTFKSFMDSALYDPETGFYSKRVPKEDFYTAPELHPAFSQVLAARIVKGLARVRATRPNAPLFVVEMGSGSGALARQVLTALQTEHAAWFARIRYVLVERVEDLMLESVLSLQSLAPGKKVLGYSRLEDMQPVCGVLFSNELVDAFPVHLLQKENGRMREVYVKSRKHGKGKVRSLGLLSSRALVHEARAVAPNLENGAQHAVNLEARDWIRRAAQRMLVGELITIDYGKKLAHGAPNPPRTYYRHTIGDDPLARPGREDITAGADFGDLVRFGRAAGLKERSYESFSKFLIDGGILDRLPSGADPASFAERARVKTLFHPDGMGESFKVLVQEKGFTGL
jgi:SAM-dependent MidA family methyltransferase